jgi:pimeloyl-ACP methyl ester carboxylesterase
VRLILVHGIGTNPRPQQKRTEWVSALAVGAAAAGHERFATLLRTGSIESTFVRYDDLYQRPDEQGHRLDLDASQAAIIHTMLQEIIDYQWTLRGDDDSRRILRHATHQLEPSGSPQGLLAPVRRLLGVATTLLSLPVIRPAGHRLTGELMLADLKQVARYLARDDADDTGTSIDTRIRRRLLAALDDGPAVVVAHSLGSVVALETLHEWPGRVPLLVTLGSPIGLRGAVWHHIAVACRSTPLCVGRWLNYWDRDDLVTARPVVETFVRPNAHGVAPRSTRVESAGVWVHSATTYLQQPKVAAPIAEAFTPVVGQQ